MAAKTVFISFNYDMNRYFKNVLLSWDKNREYSFQFYDASLRDLFDSANGDYLKAKLKAMIQDASQVLFVIGEKCARSKWVAWEAQLAFELGKPVAAVKVDQNCPTPKALQGQSVNWASAFEFAAIKSAIEGSVAPVASQAANPQAGTNPQAAATPPAA